MLHPPRSHEAPPFLVGLLREPDEARRALAEERARWLGSLARPGREALLFELELWLRALELEFSRRRGALNVDSSGSGERLLAIRDALHRARSIARMLTSSGAEQGVSVRRLVERERRGDVGSVHRTRDLAPELTPAESLYVLQHRLRALHGLADQLLRLPSIPGPGVDDLAFLGEDALLSSVYFRPPGALEFRREYDRVGSAPLSRLVEQEPNLEARKALALAFVACFRLLRALRHLPPAPVAAPRRSQLLLRLVVEETQAVEGYLSGDLPRLVRPAGRGALLGSAAEMASAGLRQTLALVNDLLGLNPIERADLNRARQALSSAAKLALSGLAKAVQPQASASELFDDQAVRRERAERLRRSTWVLSELLRSGLDGLLPALEGAPTDAADRVTTVVRYGAEFRATAYWLFRPGDRDPFDRHFALLESLLGAPVDPTRDRQLFLECRRFLALVERALTLIGRRAELSGVEPDVVAYQRELERARSDARSGTASVESPSDALFWAMVGGSAPDLPAEDAGALEVEASPVADPLTPPSEGS